MKRILGILTIIAALTFQKVQAQSPVHLRKIGSFNANGYNVGSAEISAFDKKTNRLFVVNGATGDIDMVDISNPSSPFLAGTIDLSQWGAGANSVAVEDDIVAAAVENYNKQADGFVVFFTTHGIYKKHVTVGALPDMITFTPDGKTVLVACEGEPNDAYTVDPLGVVSIIDFPNINGVKQSKVWNLNFTAFNSMVVPASMKINGPGATIAQDLEPEYVSVTEDSKTAFVTLQENNAIAKIDIKHRNILSIIPLGTQDHNLPGFGMDASDQNSGVVNITTWPVKGLFQPDAIAAFKTDAGEFLVMANEGDVREYTGFAEAKRVSTLTLDPVAFPNAGVLKNNNNLGRLNVTKSLGDTDNDLDYDELYSFGSRSVSIRDKSGNLIWDSGDFLEQMTLQRYPAYFNASNTSNTKKNRSDDKGPEPEGLTVAEILDSVYLFLALERIGGVVVFNVTDVYNPYFVEYVNTRDFNAIPALNSGGDLGPEGMLFISAKDSPNDKSLLVVSNEISGTVTIFEADYSCGHDKVLVCYNGSPQCIHDNMINFYLQNGAVFGDCSSLRLAKNTSNDQSFMWNTMYNAGNGTINISWENSQDEQYEISVFDISGKIIHSQTVLTSNNSETLSKSDLSSGLYFVRLSGKNFEETKKIVIN